jgi:hypothetical protein
LLAAVVALPAGALAGHLREGAAVATGLLLGALNAPMARAALGLGLGFAATSLARLAILTVAGLAAGALLGWGLTVAFVVAGLALAQLIMVAASARELLRA